jgi:galactose mutarotase-like enzyme
MEEKIKIENDFLSVIISRRGATLDSVFFKPAARELLWQGDKESWPGKDLVIFPFVARLMDGWYLHRGVKYQMPIHGLAPYLDFGTAEKSDSALTLRLRFSEKTLKCYPFRFEFTVYYRLIKNSLITSYEVKNLDEEEMYFYLGGHPGYALDYMENDETDDTSANSVIFEKAQNLCRYTADESGYFITGEDRWRTADELFLSKSLFANDAIILKDLKGGLTIRRPSGIDISFDLNNPPVLALWSHKRRGGYVCVEPWWGLPDENPPKRELKTKLLINRLPPLGVFNYEFATKYEMR